ncbi:MAG: hypothetical protein KGN32_15470 [Burkholderiales bacterium]|nr:hypothetical protein [Burkholderiales bacterium]
MAYSESIDAKAHHLDDIALKDSVGQQDGQTGHGHHRAGQMRDAVEPFAVVHNCITALVTGVF